MAHLEQQTSSTDLVYQLEDKPPLPIVWSVR